MEKAVLFCPKERVFFKEWIGESYVIPSDERPLSKVGKLKVKILEVLGDKVLVLLPKRFSRGKRDTALVDIEYVH